MPTLTIAGKQYASTGEPAPVMSSAFRELCPITTDGGGRGLLYQHATDQRLAFAPATPPFAGPMAVYLERIKR